MTTAGDERRTAMTRRRTCRSMLALAIACSGLTAAVRADDVYERAPVYDRAMQLADAGTVLSDVSGRHVPPHSVPGGPGDRATAGSQRRMPRAAVGCVSFRVRPRETRE